MIGKTKQNIPLFDYERGQKITVNEVNAIVLNAYLKFNNLIPDNVAILTSGQFRGETYNNDLIYPNYCGIMSVDQTMYTCDPTNEQYGLTDNLCLKLIREADEVLKYMREV